MWRRIIIHFGFSISSSGYRGQYFLRGLFWISSNYYPYLTNNISAAVLITGDFSAEVYLPSSGVSCSLPTQPDSRRGHTQDNGLLCGGDETSDSCLRWSSDTGTWEQFTLDVWRSAHVSWTPDPDTGTFLMGGSGYERLEEGIYDSGSKNTTSLIKPDGSQEPGFSLKYNTGYVK